jgi:predicted nucleic acid-binding protein
VSTANWLVVDASVAAKWFVQEEHSARSRGLITSGAILLAPDLIVPEVGNVFLKKVRQGTMSLSAFAEAVDAIDLFLTLIPSGRVFFGALTLAFEHGRSFYDSLYVTLAMEEGCQLVTADERLYNALRTALPDNLLWVGDLPESADIDRADAR